MMQQNSEIIKIGEHTLLSVVFFGFKKLIVPVFVSKQFALKARNSFLKISYRGPNG